ncbi:hypothetical protein Vau01_122440 [Virgisporangium aurantiacum]|uniref:Uncharacterized protein n=1 Tax=Virgisporangium aurantiacum TaxID=175570 RepID=A0A8J3ZL05_9ACTN|nr:hypothetical protein Vau01_122440 [Virgisporangium aurantiacum]
MKIESISVISRGGMVRVWHTSSSWTSVVRARYANPAQARAGPTGVRAVPPGAGPARPSSRVRTAAQALSAIPTRSTPIVAAGTPSAANTSWVRLSSCRLVAVGWTIT